MSEVNMSAMELLYEINNTLIEEVRQEIKESDEEHAKFGEPFCRRRQNGQERKEWAVGTERWVTGIYDETKDLLHSFDIIPYEIEGAWELIDFTYKSALILMTKEIAEAEKMGVSEAEELRSSTPESIRKKWVDTINGECTKQDELYERKDIMTIEDLDDFWWHADGLSLYMQYTLSLAPEFSIKVSMPPQEASVSADKVLEFIQSEYKAGYSDRSVCFFKSVFKDLEFYEGPLVFYLGRLMSSFHDKIKDDLEKLKTLKQEEKDD